MSQSPFAQIPLNRQQNTNLGLSANPIVSAPIDSMDPRLQFLIARKRSGAQVGLGVSTGEDEIAVVARVSDVKAWERLSEVRVGVTIEGKSKNDAIVTARIPVQRVEYVRQQTFVKSLKAARPLKRMLQATVEETQARPVDLPAASQADGGSGVVVGIVDYDCDFAHRNFHQAGGGSRIETIWNQRGLSGANTPAGFAYGREYSAVEIDAAVNSGSPYTALGYAPPLFPLSHGTHVMDIAAGNGQGSGVAGVAPKADLIFVDISHADLPFGIDEVDKIVGSSFGDSTRLLEAVKYIFDKAGSRPCVVNISLGTNGGPHDGSTLVEEGIDRLLTQAPNRAVCIAASNSFSDGIHASGTVVQDNFVDLQWQVAANDESPNEFELWYDGQDKFDVELIAPGGHSFGRTSPGAPLALSNQAGNVVAFIANRLDDPNNHDNMIGVYLERNMPQWNPAGMWTVRLHGVDVTNGDFHAWIERDNAMQSSFALPHDNTHTVGSISCGQKTIVVGSYDGHKASKPISFFSSAGPTRDGREKPEISAPGHAVAAARSRSFAGTTIMSGTSMASPAVAGICALALSEASKRGIDVSIDDLRDLIVDSGRRSPPSGTAWHDQFGNGRIDASDIVQAIINMDDGSPSSPASSKKKKASKKKATRKKTTKKRAARKSSSAKKSSKKKKTSTRKKATKKRSKA